MYVYVYVWVWVFMDACMDAAYTHFLRSGETAVREVEVEAPLPALDWWALVRRSRQNDRRHPHT